MGIRLSIGAGRSRLLRMLLTEILLLATLAGALSVYIAFEAPAIFAKMLATSSMPVYQTKPDLQVLIYLGAIILCATVIAGLSPAGESLRVDLHSAMKAGTGGITAGEHAASFLIGAQVAMSLVLLVCAGLFIRARSTMLTADPGFDARRVLFVRSAPLAAATDRILKIPGVESVAYGYPLSQRTRSANAGGTGVRAARRVGENDCHYRRFDELLGHSWHPAAARPLSGKHPRGRGIASVCTILLAWQGSD